MALTSAYLITTKNLESFLNAIKSAKAPERLTNAFLKQLDFTSSNDRLLIGVMKGLGMLDDTGAPTSRYYDFLDQGQSGRVLADAIREAYEDLFAINKQANDMSVEQIKNKLRTLTQGQKSDNVINSMANTFKALCELADWQAVTAHPKPAGKKEPASAEAPIEKPPKPPAGAAQGLPAGAALNLHYNIQIHLPESRDPAVFEAIFQALRKHLP